MSNDVPQLIEQSRVRCEELDRSLLSTQRGLNELEQVLHELDPRLTRLQLSQQTVLQVSQASLDELEQELDQLTQLLEADVSRLSEQVERATREVEQQEGVVQAAGVNLVQHSQQVRGDHSQRHQNESDASQELYQRLRTLASQLQADTQDTLVKVDQARQQLADERAALREHEQQLSQQTVDFRGAVSREGQRMDSGLVSASSGVDRQVELFRQQWQEQLDRAVVEVQRRLQSEADSLGKDADGVEALLGEILQFLKHSRESLNGTIRPPIQMVNRVFDSLQPIINLLGTLRDLGLL